MNTVKLIENENKEREIAIGDLFLKEGHFYMLVEIFYVLSEIDIGERPSDRYQLIKLEKGQSIGGWKSLEDFIGYYHASSLIRLEDGESIKVTHARRF